MDNFGLIAFWVIAGSMVLFHIIWHWPRHCDHCGKLVWTWQRYHENYAHMTWKKLHHDDCAKKYFKKLRKKPR